MANRVSSLTRDCAGNYFGNRVTASETIPNTSAPEEGSAVPGLVESTHGMAGDITLAKARAVLAFVIDHTDDEIAAACRALHSSPEADERDKADAEFMLRHLTGVEAANA